MLSEFASGGILNVTPMMNGKPGRVGILSPSQTRLSEDQLKKCDALESVGILKRGRLADDGGYQLRHKDYQPADPLPATAGQQQLSEATRKHASLVYPGFDSRTGRYDADFVARSQRSISLVPPKRGK